MLADGSVLSFTLEADLSNRHGEGVTWKLSISLTLLLLSPVGKVLVFCDSMDDRF